MFTAALQALLKVILIAHYTNALLAAQNPQINVKLLAHISRNQALHGRSVAKAEVGVKRIVLTKAGTFLTYGVKSFQML